MKLIKGLEDAKKFLLDLRKFGIDNIPNETLELILESNNFCINRIVIYLSVQFLL